MLKNFEVIKLSKLKKIDNINGDIMHILRNDHETFSGFGEAYFTSIKYNKVKAWKKHNQMTMNLVVPLGLVKFVFYLKQNNEFREEIIGYDRYMRLTVPPGIWFGFKGINNSENLILNIASVLHDPEESESCAVEEIKYKW